MNWNAIRVVNGSQNDGFEELVCQLANKEPIEGRKAYYRNGKRWGGMLLRAGGRKRDNMASKVFHDVINFHPMGRVGQFRQKGVRHPSGYVPIYHCNAH